jgi:hypothetical protein
VPPTNYYLSKGKAMTDLLAVPGVSALLSTSAPVVPDVGKVGTNKNMPVPPQALGTIMQ